MCNCSCSKRIWRCRYLIAFMAFMCLVMSHTIRVGINVTLLSMVKDSANGHAPINSSYYCHVTKIEKNKKPQVFSVFGEIKLPKIVTGEYKWDRPTQGLILGAFFWGHIFTHIPGGLLSVKFGPKWVAFCSILSCGLVELCIPISSHLSYITVIILRMIEGLLLGALSPAIGCLLGNWAPPGEKSRFGSLIGCGTQLGTVIGQILAGVISYPRLVDLNTEPQTFMYISYWPYVHYLFGVLNVLFALLWSVIVYDRPQKHPWISNKEKQYLIENIYNDVNAINTVNQAEKPNITDKAEKSIENGKITESLPPNISVEQTQWEFWKFSVPWKAILQSKSVWSVLICHFVYDWGWFTLVTCMPTYLSRVLGFNILSNSFLSSIPYIVQIVVSLTVAFLSDIFIVHKLLSTTWIRRVNNFIALAGLGIGIISVGLVGCNAYVAVGIFSVTVGLMGFSAAGFFSNTLDIAAPYAGNISSIASTFASVSGIFAPLIVGFVTKDNSNLTNWFIIFGVSSGLAWLGAFINLYLTSGEVEPWASLPSS